MLHVKDIFEHGHIFNNNPVIEPERCCSGPDEATTPTCSSGGGV